MAPDDLVERELLFNRFHRLLAEVIRCETSRTVFQQWEVEILMDIEACKLEPKGKAATLRQYLRAVERQMGKGPGPPMKLSEFFQRRSTRRPSRT